MAEERPENDDGGTRLFRMPRTNHVHIDDGVRHRLTNFIGSGMLADAPLSPIASIFLANAQAGVSLMLDEPMFLHAIAAVSSVQKATLPIIHTSLYVPVDYTNSQPGLHHYCNALYQSRRYFARAPQDSSSLFRMILINFFLFLFELHQGDWINSRRHRRFCLAILNEHQKTWGKVDLDDAIIAGIMVGNENGQHSVLMNLPVPQLRDASTETVRAPPHLNHRLSGSEFHLHSIEEAATLLEALVQNSKDFQQELLVRVESACKRPMWKDFATTPVRQRCLMHCMSRLVELDSETQQRQNNLIDNHARWKRAFGELLTGHPSTYTELLCQISFFASWCSIIMCRWTREIVSDDYTAAFVHALDLVDQFMRARGLAIERHGPALPPARHNASVWEYGPVPTLYTTSLKCRNRAVRWRAVQTLGSLQRIENLQDSFFLAQVASTVIRLEQERALGLDAQAVEGELLEQTRFLDVVVGSRPGEDGLVDMVCGRISTLR